MRERKNREKQGGGERQDDDMREMDET